MRGMALVILVKYIPFFIGIIAFAMAVSYITGLWAELTADLTAVL